MLETTPIELTESKGLVHAVMHSPGAGELASGLSAVIDRFEHDDARVLLLSSSIPGRFADPGGSAGSGRLEQFEREAMRRPLDRLAACRKPSIAAIDGRAIGLGLELALACTLRFCTPGSRFGLPGLDAGEVPMAGGTQRLPRLVGRGPALDLLLTGRTITSDEALRIGLVERLYYRDLMREAEAVAAALAASPAAPMALVMSCVEAAGDLPLDEGLLVERAAALSLLD